ncbi:type 1 glutamine amidotransferase domain-containing protein [Pseudopontixanthobacter vadosimaris]|uniref:type 1 glutamine amidotransferase domain-containing protein n=1 Tax=Pseudopontixanthobacter vadosimaris TaxID=2726450 RepID=UPI0014731D7B|nr:type 1 glutamine amidotransferase domain-containing protein [Pseudopontixanthobacter vadosimaris]
MKILMVLTSHDKLGDTGKKTGFWLEEFAAPYYVLKDAGHEITLASPKGGKPPLDPASDEPDAQTEATKRYKKDADAQARLASTEKLADVDVATFDGVFYPGGHGPLWDLAESAESKAIIEDALGAGKPVALVCHAPAVLKNVTGQDGEPIVKGRKITGFTNQEEDAVGLTDVVPFLLEDVLIKQGGTFSKQGVFEPYVVQDGLLITGQNPPSSEPAAEKLLEVLKKR